MRFNVYLDAIVEKKIVPNVEGKNEIVLKLVSCRVNKF
jgi:hypothetical protein